MTTTTAGKDSIVAPEEERSTIATIEEYLESKRGRAARLVGPSRDGVPLPSSLRRVLVAAARQLADGNGVSVMPVTAEVTTQQAADLLNVSRPFVIGLLDKGEIPFHKVGTHRPTSSIKAGLIRALWPASSSSSRRGPADHPGASRLMLFNGPASSVRFKTRTIGRI